MDKDELRHMIKEELTKRQLNEKLEDSDYSELKDFIRSEVAAIFFDLFKKRSTWT
jgi:hypothetical protein